MGVLEAILAVLDVKFAAILPHLDERQRRLYLVSEAAALGHGGIAAVARLAEVSESTIARGRDELATGRPVLGRVRRPGGGRKSAPERDPGLVPALVALIEPQEIDLTLGQSMQDKAITLRQLSRADRVRRRLPGWNKFSPSAFEIMAGCFAEGEPSFASITATPTPSWSTPSPCSTRI